MATATHSPFSRLRYTRRSAREPPVATLIYINELRFGKNLVNILTHSFSHVNQGCAHKKQTLNTYLYTQVD